MVGIRIEGRLGNQLFQYAFIYTAAKKLNTRFYLDKSIDRQLLYPYFNIPTDFCQPFDDYLFSVTGFKNIFSYHLRYRFYKTLSFLFGLKKVKFNSAVSPALQTNLVKNNSVYEGFFQSEQYFAACKSEIAGLFTVKDIYKQQFSTVWGSLPGAKHYVTVHIRRGDYLAGDFALDAGYYHNAINVIHNENNYYIFISDDIGFVKREFDYLANSYFSEHDEITDIQFLMNADICILSNSSFSWWGAWLNNRNATIFAPKYWLGNAGKKEFPVDVIPGNWVKI